MGIGLVLGAAATLAAPPAEGPRAMVYLPLQQGNPPLATQSRYIVKTATTTFYNYGCKQRTSMALDQTGVVVLLFGRPHYNPETGEYGTNLLDAGGTFASTVEIARAAKAWVDGFWECQPEPRPHVTLAIGTSNQGDPAQISPAHARAWATLVSQVATYVRDHEYDDVLAIAGASNIELNFNGPAVTRAWVDAYAQSTPRRLYVVMDCAGCPSVNYPDWQPNNGWTLHDIAHVVWYAPPSLPLPQVYDPDGVMAAQWQYVAHWVRNDRVVQMRIAGAFTQFQACADRTDPCTGINNTPAQGWQQLQAALNSDPDTAQELTTVTDVRWDF